MSQFHYSTLKKSPQLREELITLIEESFEYDPGHSFETDFFPLFSSLNEEHNHLLMQGEKLVGHIGVKKRFFSLEGKTLPVVLLGGIAISSTVRGQGLFNDFFQKVLTEYQQECGLFLLWSEKSSLYEKFNFLEVGIQKEYTLYGTVGEWQSLTTLNDDEKKFIITCFNTHKDGPHLLLDRSEENWNDVFSISSINVHFVKYQNKPIGYLFKDKGFDLQGITHEYGYLKEFEKEFFTHMTRGVLWGPSGLPLTQNRSLYLSFMKVGNRERLNQFLRELKVTSAAYEMFDLELLQRLFGPYHEEEVLFNPIIFGADSI